MRRKADKEKDLKEDKLKNKASKESSSGESSSEEKSSYPDFADSDGDDKYAYEEGEFNPDKWENYSSGRKRRFFQNGMGLFVSIIALILFAALFVVEFRSYTKVKKDNSGYVTSEKKEDTVKVDDKILEIIETGTNYTIYLDHDTGIEYVMFRVGSSMTIQPLINPDGSYKQYVEPTTSAATASEGVTRHKWTDNFKIPGVPKEPQSTVPVPASSAPASGTPVTGTKSSAPASGTKAPVSSTSSAGPQAQGAVEETRAAAEVSAMQAPLQEEETVPPRS